MTKFPIPTRDDVTPENQATFDALKSKLGMVPNLYATFAHSDTALGTYLTLQNAKTSLGPKAKEVVNLVTSQVNGCAYCLAAHTALGGMVGFSGDEILEIRAGAASFDAKLDGLARFTKAVASERGHVGEAAVAAFLDAGWSRAELVDVIVLIGDKTISNYLHAATDVPVDFPAAPELSTGVAAE